MGNLEKQYGKGFLDSIKFDPPDIKETASPNTGNAGAKNALGIDWSNPASAAAKNVIAGPIEDNLGIFTNSSGGGGENWFNKFIGRMGGLSNVAQIGMGTINSFLPQRITSKGVDNLNKVFSVANNIPVVGKYTQAAQFFMNAIDSLGATKLATLNNNQEIQDTLANTGGGYGDFMADWDAASALSGQRAGLFANHTALNNQIYDANRQMSILQGIVGKKKTDDTLIAQMGDRANERTMLDLNGGFGNVMFGRLGLKVEILPKVHAILNKPKVVDTLTEFEEEVPEFKEGGKMNVIPEGSLHARLHHMENADGLTKKGIPVVSIAEGGELEQQAEIELNEIIFNLEVTQTLEKLMEDGSDNAAIEAGKLLVKEIFENTDDRTGLIKDLEPEKKEPTTEDIVNNHQVF